MVYRSCVVLMLGWIVFVLVVVLRRCLRVLLSLVVK